MTGTGQSTGAGATPELGGVDVGCNGDRVCVRMWGEHDLSTVGLLNTALLEAIAAGDLDVVVDLSDVAFIDGSTVRALVDGHALLAACDRRLRVQSPSPAQRNLLQICDLEDLIEPTSAEAPSQERGASTPLATWVEIPATPQPAKGSPPVDADVSHDDPERSRR